MHQRITCFKMLVIITIYESWTLDTNTNTMPHHTSKKYGTNKHTTINSKTTCMQLKITKQQDST